MPQRAVLRIAARVQASSSRYSSSTRFWRRYVGFEIGQHQVRIAALQQAVQHLIEGMLVAVAVGAVLQLFKHRIEQLVFLRHFSGS
ncbi:Uncharacterised protein [Klebsiella variicola]|nr:Uncharacterised protein [Klebsiella variicola]